jgi:hypothetical protein
MKLMRSPCCLPVCVSPSPASESQNNVISKESGQLDLARTLSCLLSLYPGYMYCGSEGLVSCSAPEEGTYAFR